MKKGKRTVRPFPYVLVTRVALNFLAKYSHENSRRADLDWLVPDTKPSHCKMSVVVERR